MHPAPSGGDLMVHLPAIGRRVLLAMAPLLLLLEVPGAVEMVRRPHLGLRLRHTTVMTVENGGPASRAGLVVGDVLKRVDDQPVANYAEYGASLHGLRVGQTAELGYQRGTNSLSTTIDLVPKTTARLVQNVFMSVGALSFLFLGFVTYLRRRDTLSRYFYISCLLLSYQFLDLPTFESASVMRWLESLRTAFQFLVPAVLLRFFLMFPEGIDGTPPARHRFLLLPAALATAAFLALEAGGGYARFPRATDGILLLGVALFALYGLASVAVFVRKSRQKKRWAQWSRMRLAVVGVAVGLVPLILATVLRAVWPTHQWPVDQMAVLFLPMVPASFSLALLRSGAIDLNYLTRQALIAVALCLPIFGLGTLALSMGPLATETQRGVMFLTTALIITAGAAFSVPVRRRVSTIIDGWFFREQLQFRVNSAKVADEVSRPREPQLVAQELCDGLMSILSADRVCFYRLQDMNLELVAYAARNSGNRPPDELSAKSHVAQQTIEVGEMLLVRPLLLSQRPLRLDVESRQLLERTNADLLCPLVCGDRTLGIVTVGPRSENADYTSLHLYHIQSLVRHAAVSYDNALLHETDLAHERIETELGLARDIQAKLLPDSDLEAGPFLLSGRTVSSRQVGGDLFDYFTTNDGRVVFTVADASGKGVPASLLMSSVRTAVREIVRDEIGVRRAVERLNRDVHGMTAVQHFVALFLATLDPVNGIVEYAVAGIEPPLWYRADLGRIETLSKGGPVLGVKPTMSYQSGVIRLADGDLLVVYSDGMLDEEDADGNEYGMERLLAGVHELRQESPPIVVEELLTRIEAFGAGESTDDRTLLVVQRHRSDTVGMKHAASG